MADRLTKLFVVVSKQKKKKSILIFYFSNKRKLVKQGKSLGKDNISKNIHYIILYISRQRLSRWWREGGKWGELEWGKKGWGKRTGVGGGV